MPQWDPMGFWQHSEMHSSGLRVTARKLQWDRDPPPMTRGTSSDLMQTNLSEKSTPDVSSPNAPVAPVSTSYPPKMGLVSRLHKLPTP